MIEIDHKANSEWIAQAVKKVRDNPSLAQYIEWEGEPVGYFISSALMKMLLEMSRDRVDIVYHGGHKGPQ